MNDYYRFNQTYMVFCQTCGAVVHDTETHDKWHQQVESPKVC